MRGAGLWWPKDVFTNKTILKYINQGSMSCIPLTGSIVNIGLWVLVFNCYTAVIVMWFWFPDRSCLLSVQVTGTRRRTVEYRWDLGCYSGDIEHSEAGDTGQPSGQQQNDADAEQQEQQQQQQQHILHIRQLITGKVGTSYILKSNRGSHCAKDM